MKLKMELDVNEVVLDLVEGVAKMYIENIRDDLKRDRKPNQQVIDACDILIGYLGD